MLPILRLVSLDTGRVLEIHEHGVVGRQPGVDAQIEDHSVSRQHAVIEHGPHGWALTDRGSANGTWIGEQRVSAAYLQHGSQVRFGLASFRVELGPGETPTTAMPAVRAPRPPAAPTPPADELPPPTLPAGRPAFGRPPPAVSATGVLDFNALPSRARQRLADCLAGSVEPRPLAVHKEPGLVGPILALPVFGALLVGSLAIEFGVPGAAWMGWGALVVVAPLLFALLLAVLAAVHRLIRTRALPFPAGRFLFPLDVVEAGWSVARWPIASAEQVDAVHHLSQGRYTHTALSFKFPGRAALRFELRPRAHADAVLAALQSARVASLEAQAGGATRPPGRLDPLADA